MFCTYGCLRSIHNFFSIFVSQVLAQRQKKFFCIASHRTFLESDYIEQAQIVVLLRLVKLLQVADRIAEVVIIELDGVATSAGLDGFQCNGPESAERVKHQIPRVAVPVDEPVDDI